MGESTVFQAGETVVVGSDPEDTVGIFIERADALALERFAVGEDFELTAVKLCEASVASNPQVSCWACDEDVDVICGEAVSGW